MTSRTVEDLLREEYFHLLPEMIRVADELKSKIQFKLLPITRSLKNHESLIVKARIKDCASAISALQRRSDSSVFDPDQPYLYSLKALRDLVGIRVLAFPSERVAQINSALRSEFADWIRDPVMDKETGQQLALKYYGTYLYSPSGLTCEYQVVSTLMGLFWEVEHAAIYKSAPKLKAFTNSLQMRERTSDVHRALKAFEEEFERQLKQADRSDDLIDSR